MKKTLKYAAPVLMLPLLFASCLKDDDRIGPDSPGAITANIIEFGNLAEPSSGRTSTIPKYTIDMVSGTPTSLKIKCVGAETAKEDIRVTIAVEDGVISEYNTSNVKDGVVFVPYPTAKYAFGTMEAVIKKGEREALIPIDLKPAQFVYDADYAIGLSITSVSSGVVSGNFGKIMLGLVGRNPYDGKYTYAASANTSLQPGKTGTAELVTTGTKTVRLMPGLVITYGNVVTYTIDPVTNKLDTVTMPTTANVGTIEVDPSSHYDSFTKTLRLKWKSVGRGWTFEETLVYTGPRD